MSTLIIQVDIGPGTQWGKSSAADIIRKTCIPSVKNYAKKHGYSYNLITDSSYKSKIGPFNFLMTKAKHFAFERYLHLDTDFNTIVYIDNDIFISSTASKLPLIRGLMACAEPGKTNSQEIFSSINNLPEHTPYYNSGMFMAEKEAAKLLGDYMIHRAKNYIRAKGKNTDNMMFNEYIFNEKIIFNRLDEKWNYMPMLEGALEGVKANFLHLVGIEGKRLLDHLKAINCPMNELLEMVIAGETKLSSSILMNKNFI